MKKIIYSLLGAAFLFSACEDRLNIGQKGVIPFENFYQTDDDAQNALNNLYQSFCLNIAGNEGIYVALPVLFNEPGDDMLAAGNFYGDNDFGAQLNEFRYDSQNEVIKNAYWGLYGVIYDSNLILDNIEPTTDIKKRVCGEAVFSAPGHISCLPSVGIVLHWLTISSPQTKSLPTMKADIMDFLNGVQKKQKLLLMTLMNVQVQQTKLEHQRLLRALLSPLQVMARLFRGDYAGAKNNLKQVIQSRKYELVPTDRWANLFHTSGDLCEEMIFQANVVQNTNIGDWSNNIQRTGWMFIQFWNWRTDKLASVPSFIGVDGWGGHSIRPDFANACWPTTVTLLVVKQHSLPMKSFSMKWNGMEQRIRD